MATLTGLPVEVISNILSFVEPEDLPTCNLTCSFLYGAIKDNAALFKALYLHHLDTPAQKDLDWIKEIQDLVKLRAICAGSDPHKVRHIAFVYNTTIRLLSRTTSDQAGRPRPSVTYSPGRNTGILRDCFASPAAREAFFHQSSLFQRVREHTKNLEHARRLPTEEELMSAKLHCLYGDMTLECARTRTRGLRVYPYACSKVYDLREFTPRTRWGPFMNEGPGPIGSVHNLKGEGGVPSDRVDWEKVEAIMIVLWYNMQEKGLDRLPIFEQFWHVPFAGCWPNSYIPMPLHRELEGLELEDPYDVTGTWLRVVCFLDFNDFFAYNFPQPDTVPDHLPRPAIDDTEAVRLILVKYHVTKILPPGPEDNPNHPVVLFEGISRSLDSSHDDNANSDIRGTVRTTREGEIRWTTLSIFNGAERWRSEGVQIGGPKSTKVIGNWFDKDYHPTGPCGPTAFWKVGDRQPSAAENQITAQDYDALLDSDEDASVTLGADGEIINPALSILQVNSEDEEDQLDYEMESDSDEE